MRRFRCCSLLARRGWLRIDTGGISRAECVVVGGSDHEVAVEVDLVTGAGTRYLVLASSIPPRSRRSTWRLFRGASAVRKQLAGTDGLIGFALLARPFGKQYATLSVWRDEDALAAFAGADRPLIGTLSPEMGPTKFVRWTIQEQIVDRRGTTRCGAYLIEVTSYGLTAARPPSRSDAATRTRAP